MWELNFEIVILWGLLEKKEKVLFDLLLHILYMYMCMRFIQMKVVIWVRAVSHFIAKFQ